MSNLKQRETLVQQIAGAMGKEAYKGGEHKEAEPRMQMQQHRLKVVTLEEGIRRTGLRDGMTI